MNTELNSRYRRQTNYYRPETHNRHVTVIGCGSLGANIAVALAKMGLNYFSLYDDDRVEPHNIPNQPFSLFQVSRNKAVSTSRMIQDQYHPNECEINTFGHWTPSQELVPGLIINAPDSITVRKQVFENAPERSFIIDVRSGPESYNLYCCDTNSPRDIAFYSSTFFDESQAIGTGCGAQSTVFGSLDITAMAVNAYMRWVNRKPYPVQVLADLMTFDRDQVYLNH